MYYIYVYIYIYLRICINIGKQPLLYQPKLESYEEAVLVHDILQQMEKKLGLPYGTCRVTALIETVSAGCWLDGIYIPFGITFCDHARL